MELDYTANDTVAFLSSPTFLSSPQYCRICRGHESDTTDPLISACACTGSIGKIHTQCLRRWIKARHIPLYEALACELCKVSYRVVLRRRLVWDRQHACGWASFWHLVLATGLFGALGVIIYLMARLLMAAQDSPADVIPVALLFVGTSAISLVAVYRVLQRWFFVTTVTYVDAATDVTPCPPAFL
ncbi:hypothetical protein ACHHYP_04005 [Achlya hypogyna]|uniref:RING-CH-type domain-containing protein n=1 Tax=Achlya hypogyna TaxID=1202772 RepID=A0A1V9Z2W5_ACHHY|nr:hypothetical protein ACHHYP_04005 [Achlya hypogyna]